MKAIKFNTGRQYTAEGQVVLAWTVGEPEKDLLFGQEWLTVRFEDLSRMVSGEITVSALNQKEVMKEYDHGRYKNVWITREEKASALAAAQEV